MKGALSRGSALQRGLFAEQRTTLCHEMLAKVDECRAELVAAEAEVPKAMADAFRASKLGIVQYYQLRNVQADTSMRQTIAGTNRSTPS